MILGLLQSFLQPLFLVYVALYNLYQTLFTIFFYLLKRETQQTVVETKIILWIECSMLLLHSRMKYCAMRESSRASEGSYHDK